MTKYSNTLANLISESTGHVRVTIPPSLIAQQANSGTSLPCKGCFVIPASTNNFSMRMRIGAAPTASLGIEISNINNGNGALFVPVDDVSLLYFYGIGEADVVDILYLRG